MKFMAKFMLILVYLLLSWQAAARLRMIPAMDQILGKMKKKQLQMDRMDKSKLKNRIQQKRALWMKDRA
ncbi:hypothetical protein M5V91_13055 [Cytobacillus pseudoceanisediminis]|uniref:hypothetical protein n=1 Tax=Cytobacillus pseudoceanisediminis TaxID=3051614 RepID=UPI0021891169|nr:hypothetical protein [Cytobacillus pseudoceanisediminis]UQX56419.1 hypothetical protein M5V91_13055 [Cytobacillus pseudoceanisediminis]